MAESDTLTWHSREVKAARSRGDQAAIVDWIRTGRLRVSESNPYAQRLVRSAKGSEGKGGDGDEPTAKPASSEPLDWQSPEVRAARSRGDHDQIRTWLREGRLVPSPGNPFAGRFSSGEEAP